MDANIFNSGRPSPMRQLAHLHSLLPKHGFEYKTDDQIVIFRSEIEELYISLQVACSYLGPRPVERRFTELFKKAFEMAPPSSRRTIDLGDAYGYRYNPAFEYAAKNTFWTIATGIDAGVVVQAMSYMCRARALFIKFTGYRTPYNVLEGRLAKAIDAFTGVKPAEIPHPVFQSMEPRLVETMIWRLRRGLRADWDQFSGYNDSDDEEEESPKKNQSQNQNPNQNENKGPQNDDAQEDQPLDEEIENKDPEVLEKPKEIPDSQESLVEDSEHSSQVLITSAITSPIYPREFAFLR